MKVKFFDEAEDLHIGILGVLHLAVSIQDAMAEMFSALFVSANRVDVGVRSLDDRAGAWAANLMTESPVARHILVNAGLWPEPNREA
jgi:hypothetical protein